MQDSRSKSDEASHGRAVQDETLQDSSVDQAVLEVLGTSQKLLSVDWHEPLGSSHFANVTTKSLTDGTQSKYFLKSATGDAGRKMLDGEFRSMHELYKTMPSSVPHPYGNGRFCQNGVPVHFLLTDFVETEDRLPDQVELSKCVAALQRNSESPNGKFGFPTTTCHGQIPQQVAWDSSWTSFYSKLLESALRKDLETNGSWPMMEDISSRVLHKVIPRLLGVLESGGRSIKPVLIHGDLWDGNIATQQSTGRIFLIDAAAYYAHGEMEIGMWRCERHAIHDEGYKNAYLEQMPKSEPADEWDDRNRLYCVKMNAIHSAHHRNVKERQTAFEDMCYLVDKYAPFEPNELRQNGQLEPYLQAVEDAKAH